MLEVTKYIVKLDRHEIFHRIHLPQLKVIWRQLLVTSDQLEGWELCGITTHSMMNIHQAGQQVTRIFLLSWHTDQFCLYCWQRCLKWGLLYIFLLCNSILSINWTMSRIRYQTRSILNLTRYMSMIPLLTSTKMTRQQCCKREDGISDTGQNTARTSGLLFHHFSLLDKYPSAFQSSSRPTFQSCSPCHYVLWRSSHYLVSQTTSAKSRTSCSWFSCAIQEQYDLNSQALSHDWISTKFTEKNVWNTWTKNELLVGERWVNPH